MSESGAAHRDDPRYVRQKLPYKLDADNVGDGSAGTRESSRSPHSPQAENKIGARFDSNHEKAHQFLRKHHQCAYSNFQPKHETQGLSIGCGIVLLASYLLVISPLLAIEVLCVYDKICWAPTVDPAVPRIAGKGVVPLAIANALVLSPLGFQSTKTEATYRMRLCTCLLQAAAAIFYLTLASVFFTHSEGEHLDRLAQQRWSSYINAVKEYYDSASSLAEQESKHWRHLGGFSLLYCILAGSIAVVSAVPFIKEACIYVPAWR